VVVVSASSGAGYEVTAVRYGTRVTTKSDVFLHFGSYGEPDEPIGMDYFFWVARSPARTILVDCGFNARSGARRGRAMLYAPVPALRRLGIAPEDIGLLILTHAHYDHIGNLEEFPAAELIMSTREYEFWTGPLADRPLFATSSEASDIDALRRARDAGRLRLLPVPPAYASPAPQDVADGVRVLEVGGHTPGELVVLVSDGDAEVVLASDALHYYDELRLDRPFRHVTDLPAMYAGFELLRGLAGDGARKLVAGHDPEVMRRFPAVGSDPAGAAASDEMAGFAVRLGPTSTVSR
jgi:glyoxylase-like metal-dependent hydrolase (beta-lactamase superfamily II)